jgi:uncharacterized protein YktA (UPF0223 family)
MSNEIKKGSSFEYTMSGCSYTRITFPEAYEDPECKKYISDVFSKMQHKGKHHSFSLLYNSWTEKTFGKTFKEQYKDSVDKIYCDSGGLQLITQGRTITDVEKNQVYANQSKFGDIGFSFDEIPVSFSGGKSARLDLANRWFDWDKFEDCAKLTGQNVAKQITTFLDEKSTCKPLFIAQGNCLETYQKWTELALKEIPKEHHKYIAGVAMGAAALGHGRLEDIQRAFYFTQLPIDISNNHLHLLAVGSTTRLLPNIVFVQNGVYKDIHISYDSTTHSSGIHMGRTYLDQRNFEFPRHFDKIIWQKMYDNLINNDFHPELTIEEYYKSMNMASKKYEAKFGSRIPLIKSYVATTCAGVANFINHVEECYASKKELLKLADRQNSHLIFNSLYEVKNLDDFNYWEKEIGRFVKSHSVATDKKNNLEEFFT